MSARPRKKGGSSREATTSSGSAIFNTNKLSSTLRARDSPRNGVESTRDRESQRTLPADGLISASRNRSCPRYVGNRRRMRHTTKPPMSKKGEQ
ncbi:hypothetical protein CRG98_031379 [Punica granatum]|uniref:Uncharacterized protein n=1 Tax=Punica granatum TaxID=22663 RepID=A0A2I0IW70_PUNGR|nr:hypothetical protein CRG98_031379 [Punica granatum]